MKIDINATGKKLRVASYIRVGMDSDDGVASHELQSQDLHRFIDQNPDWELIATYIDKTYCGKKREAFQQLMEDCKAGKIDLIVTKSVSRFERNIAELISTIEMLKRLDPPVGVLFLTEDFCTLDAESDLLLKALSMVAEEESRIKAQHGGGGHRW